MKTCAACNERKPLADFYAHDDMTDGHMAKCKSCVTARKRKYRRLNDHVRERARILQLKSYSAPRKRQETLTYRLKNPTGWKAKSAVNNAVRDGRLTKEPCLFCGSAKVVAHHGDYTKPLDVKWLCHKCHRRLHTNFLESAP